MHIVIMCIVALVNIRQKSNDGEKSLFVYESPASIAMVLPDKMMPASSLLTKIVLNFDFGFIQKSRHAVCQLFRLRAFDDVHW